MICCLNFIYELSALMSKCNHLFICILTEHSTLLHEMNSSSIWVTMAHSCTQLISNHISCLCLGGIPGDHLIVPVSGHSVPSPMHLRLGQKEKAWTGEYVDKEDGMGRIEPIGDENYLDGEEEGEFEGEVWNNNEDEEEEEEEELEEDGDQVEVECEIPDFPSQSAQHPHSQQYQHYGPQQKPEEGGDVPVEDTVSQAGSGNLFRSHLSRYRAVKRLRRWQRLRSGGLGFRLTQHWKSWRQRAQWVCSQGHRWSRRGQRYNLYGKQKKIKRFQQPPYTDGEDEGNHGRFIESQRGTDINCIYL